MRGSQVYNSPCKASRKLVNPECRLRRFAPCHPAGNRGTGAQVRGVRNVRRAFKRTATRRN